MLYLFQVDIKVDGRMFTAGQVVRGEEIESGCLQSLVRLRQVVEYTGEPVTAAVESTEPAATEPAVEKPKRGRPRKAVATEQQSVPGADVVGPPAEPDSPKTDEPTSD